MTGEYLNGTYTNGYAISDAVSFLKIGPQGNIHTPGTNATYVALYTSTGRTTAVDVKNLGNVYGFGSGVRLAGGGNIANDGTIASFAGSLNDKYYDAACITIAGSGKIVNGSSGNATALIKGGSGVDITGSGAIDNFGSIDSTAITVGYYTYNKKAVYLGSGAVLNRSGADISGGIAIAGKGIVDNNGKIEPNARSGSIYIPSPGYTRLTNSILAAVQISGGGAVSNGLSNQNAVIGGGVSISGGIGTVTNDGTILDGSSSLSAFYFTLYTSYASVQLSGGGRVTNGTANDTAALLKGGVSISGGSGVVNNSGTVGYSLSQYLYSSFVRQVYSEHVLPSVALGKGGSILNGSSSDLAAVMTGGVSVSGGVGMVTNFGTIETPLSFPFLFYTNYFLPGVSLMDGGKVVNGSSTDFTATIAGYDAGIYVTGGAGRITNFGALKGGTGSGGHPVGPQAGIALMAGGAITNGSVQDASASISGTVGIALYGSGMITNYGTISGTEGAVVLHSPSEKLIEESSGVLVGTVKGGGGVLVLGGATGTGTLSGLGSAITGFGRIEVPVGSAWVIANHGSIAAGTTFSNDGRVAVAASGTLTIDGGMTGFGLLAIRPNATAAIAGAVSARETVRFAGTDTELILGTPSEFLGAVSNFGGHGTCKLELTGFGTGTTFTVSPNGNGTGDILTVKDGAQHARINLLGQFAASGFHAAISAGYTVFTYSPPATPIHHLAPSG